MDGCFGFFYISYHVLFTIISRTEEQLEAACVFWYGFLFLYLAEAFERRSSNTTLWCSAVLFCVFMVILYTLRKGVVKF